MFLVDIILITMPIHYTYTLLYSDESLVKMMKVSIENFSCDTGARKSCLWLPC